MPRLTPARRVFTLGPIVDEADKETLDRNTLDRTSGVGRKAATLIVNGPDGVSTISLSLDEPVVIGRAEPSDHTVRDPNLSRRHARFTWIGDRVRIEDLGSRNGTHLRGRRVEQAELGPGDAVSLGDVTIQVALASLGAPLLRGVETYQRFFSRLEAEQAGARSFRREHAVVWLVPAEPAVSSPRWAETVCGLLREADLLTVHGRAAIVLLPQTGPEQARTVAEMLVTPREDLPVLICGVATSGESAHARVDLARALVKETDVHRRVAFDVRPSARPPVLASAAMKKARDLAVRAAPSKLHVLVRGETGSGKEVLARMIHESSPRAGKAMRSVNCGALPDSIVEGLLFGHERGAFTGADETRPGLFEQAHEGTLLLDEVGELSPRAQATLLRVLETGRVRRLGGTEEIAVDVRVIAASHVDLERRVADGDFRQDLFYRLNSVTLEVPPLRERPEDIGPLVSRFLAEAGREDLEISPAAIDAMRAHAWPGNVRELRNAVERALVICRSDTIGVEDLPPNVRGTREETSAPADLKARVKAYEAELIVDALRRAGGNKTKAAELLRVPVRTLSHKIKQYGIKARFRAD